MIRHAVASSRRLRAPAVPDALAQVLDILPSRSRRPPAAGSRRPETLARDATVGAVAGVVATFAMTLAAKELHARLPARERYPLPPREITEPLLPARVFGRRVSEPTVEAATLASHTAFGAAAGAVFWPLFRDSRHPALGGVAYALGVWTASYFGWVPLSGRLKPAYEHPPRRNALMIAAHVVWGATLGLVARSLSRALAPMGRGPLRDRPRRRLRASQ